MDLKRIFKFKLKQIVGIRVCSVSPSLPLSLSYSYSQVLSSPSFFVRLWQNSYQPYCRTVYRILYIHTHGKRKRKCEKRIKAATSIPCSFYILRFELFFDFVFRPLYALLGFLCVCTRDLVYNTHTQTHRILFA